MRRFTAILLILITVLSMVAPVASAAVTSDNVFTVIGSSRVGYRTDHGLTHRTTTNESTYWAGCMYGNQKLLSANGNIIVTRTVDIAFTQEGYHRFSVNFTASEKIASVSFYLVKNRSYDSLSNESQVQHLSTTKLTSGFNEVHDGITIDSDTFGYDIDHCQLVMVLTSETISTYDNVTYTVDWNFYREDTDESDTVTTVSNDSDSYNTWVLRSADSDYYYYDLVGPDYSYCLENAASTVFSYTDRSTNKSVDATVNSTNIAQGYTSIYMYYSMMGKSIMPITGTYYRGVYISGADDIALLYKSNSSSETSCLSRGTYSNIIKSIAGGVTKTQGETIDYTSYANVTNTFVIRKYKGIGELNIRFTMSVVPYSNTLSNPVNSLNNDYTLQSGDTVLSYTAGDIVNTTENKITYYDESGDAYTINYDTGYYDTTTNTYYYSGDTDSGTVTYTDNSVVVSNMYNDGDTSQTNTYVYNYYQAENGDSGEYSGTINNVDNTDNTDNSNTDNSTNTGTGSQNSNSNNTNNSNSWFGNITITIGDIIGNIFGIGSSSEDGENSEESEGVISKLFKTLFGKLGELISAIASGIISFVETVLLGLIDALISLVNALMERFNAVIESIMHIFEVIPSFFKGFMSFLGAAFAFLPDEVIMLIEFGLLATFALGIFLMLRR